MAGDGARRILPTAAHHEEAAPQHRDHSPYAHALARRRKELKHLGKALLMRATETTCSQNVGSRNFGQPFLPSRYYLNINGTKKWPLMTTWRYSFMFGQMILFLDCEDFGHVCHKLCTTCPTEKSCFKGFMPDIKSAGTGFVSSPRNLVMSSTFFTRSVAFFT